MLQLMDSFIFANGCLIVVDVRIVALVECLINFGVWCDSDWEVRYWLIRLDREESLVLEVVCINVCNNFMAPIHKRGSFDPPIR